DQLKDALHHERFVLEAQPIIDLRSGRITEYELLIRLPSEDGELVPPGTFLYLAERYDLITDIDRNRFNITRDLRQKRRLLEGFDTGRLHGKQLQIFLWNRTRCNAFDK
ncbi:MAG: EAL domain-containing protein, partial [Pirellula sp.]